MRTDTLTALLLDPFLTFEEAVRQCGTTAPTRADRPSARPSGTTGQRPRRRLPASVTRPFSGRAEVSATTSR